MQKENLITIRNNLISQMIALGIEIGNLEALIATSSPLSSGENLNVTNIAQGGVAGSESYSVVSLSEQLRILNDVQGKKIEELERINYLISAMYPWEFEMKMV